MRTIYLFAFTLFSFSLLAQENNSLLCSDGIDNDNDGQVDCADQECISIPNLGCSICETGLSFADELIAYQSGCPEIDPFPEGALGVADYWGHTGDEAEFVFLGEEGFIKLGFTNNTLSNSGDNTSDLFVFEVGPAVESMSISLRPKDQATKDKLINDGFQDVNMDGFYFITNIGGATAFVDLDATITGYSTGELLFDAIELKDLPDSSCGGTTPGADVDAVCAIFSVDCNGIQFGTSIIDECGGCLEPDDPNFNQSCIDCMGTPNGTAIIDDCGECLEPDDPNFNQSCIDCMGTPNGTAIIDECGECLQPDDPSFNQSCIDCMGVINGTAIIDECGECLEPDDPNFNQSCIDCMGTPNGTAIIDDCGECLEPDDPNFNQSCIDCLGVLNGTAVIDECGECLQPDDPSFNQSCIDCMGVINGTAIIDECGECLQPDDPNFDATCEDCLGIINGTAIIDDCGECLQPDDPDFNQSCIDCMNVPNGTAIIDDCSECLQPDDPDFNQSCIDCMNVPNGIAIIDDCGECLQPNDPDFNQSCLECALYIPNIFSPNNDGINEVFKPYSCPESNLDILNFTIFDRWGNLIFQENNFKVNNPKIFWDGTLKNKRLNPGVFSYLVTSSNFNNQLQKYHGTITLIR